DSLYSISRRFYGTEEMALVIQQMNHLENADLIKVGQELQLP
ncbi:MAG: LysM peptidoglycan-binding domain-containing protein, partial [Lachnospiraceae bacterium]|nr:LysM peptidoglycan-binding domain-containing protein [Lachnospiraceae bacterium]